MKKWRMIIDIEKCEDCNNCFLACKDEHVDNDWPGYTAPQPRHENRWIDIYRNERGSFPHVDAAYRPTPCMHCDNAPCVAAGNGAVVKRSDGIVLIDPEKATGNKALIDSCPYGVIFWNEELSLPQKCTFCAHLLDGGWAVPRCVHSCPTNALSVEFIDDAEMERLMTRESLERLHDEWGTAPNVYYKNLFLYDSSFVAGSVDVTKDGITDCLEGAKVSLFKDGNLIDETHTDTYGDFKFDGLPKTGDDYTIDVSPDGFEKKTVTVRIDESVDTGTISF